MIALLMGLNVRQFQNETTNTVDVASLNERFKQIAAGLANNENKDKLEAMYECQIFLKDEADYSSNVMASIKNSKILMDYESGNELLGKIVFSGERDLFNSSRRILKNRMIQNCIIMLFPGYLLIGLIYYFYIRPFKKLQLFAANIAKGDLAAPLSIHKGNYFGAFTESFDIMREELKTAKEYEYKANVSKKELVAELSHDMKTPIATIKATCEVIRMKVIKSGNEEGQKDILEKVGVIERKADMTHQLIGNMFHATLEELKNLKVEPMEELSTQIAGMLNELQHYDTIMIKSSVPECLVYMDSLRFKQVIDNVVNNGRKNCHL